MSNCPPNGLVQLLQLTRSVALIVPTSLTDYCGPYTKKILTWSDRDALPKYCQTKLALQISNALILFLLDCSGACQAGPHPALAHATNVVDFHGRLCRMLYLPVKLKKRDPSVLTEILLTSMSF